MNMHDKDMDALFRNKLADLEVEPSPMVWANINNELGAQDKRKSYVPLLRIAASVAILVTAGMIFLTNKKDDVIDKLVNRTAMNSNVKAPVKAQPAIVPSTIVIKQTGALKEEPEVVTAQPTQRIAQAVRHTIAPATTGTTSTTQTTVDPVKPATIADPNPASMLASADTRTNTVKPVPVLPDNDVALKPAVDQSVATQSTSVLATNSENDIKPTKKRKIHGLGGFINAVVGAVDKRDDKIIEFTETDEGDAVTGINLGLFRVKKQK